MARKENDKLNTIGGGASKLRLACEVNLLGTGSMIIELFGFGSGFFSLGGKAHGFRNTSLFPERDSGGA
ncbi:hypothetical protein KIP88_43550 [Bradyrhizobium sp. SRL28]|uniref:hypothetical protein n=1 Tax=Bradyrhizobium sp. SRL28 TaxID=2836178 RepID=UPI001BDEB99F|nr:hypothetical protein [Bradyrhizobium sp. SRL28]MBT1517217.1 hypothetical protein [Bradyrhizobium sp. SRL28]